MIEIQVNGLIKSFEVGHNVLDGLSFQIDQGEGWACWAKTAPVRQPCLKY